MTNGKKDDRGAIFIDVFDENGVKKNANKSEEAVESDELIPPKYQEKIKEFQSERQALTESFERLTRTQSDVFEANKEYFLEMMTAIVTNPFMGHLTYKLLMNFSNILSEDEINELYKYNAMAMHTHNTNMKKYNEEVTKYRYEKFIKPKINPNKGIFDKQNLLQQKKIAVEAKVVDDLLNSYTQAKQSFDNTPNVINIEKGTLGDTPINVGSKRKILLVDNNGKSIIEDIDLIEKFKLKKTDEIRNLTYDEQGKIVERYDAPSTYRSRNIKDISRSNENYVVDDD